MKFCGKTAYDNRIGWPNVGDPRHPFQRSRAPVQCGQKSSLFSLDANGPFMAFNGLFEPDGKLNYFLLSPCPLNIFSNSPAAVLAAESNCCQASSNPLATVFQPSAFDAPT